MQVTRVVGPPQRRRRRRQRPHLLCELATEVSGVLGRRVTAWEIDHAIWASARAVRTEMQPDQDGHSPETAGMVPDSQAAEVVAELAYIRDRLDTVLTTIGGQSSRRVVLALDNPDEPDVYFVLATALRDWADGLRHRAQDAPDDPNREDFQRWAETAKLLHDRIDKAL